MISQRRRSQLGLIGFELVWACVHGWLSKSENFYKKEKLFRKELPNWFFEGDGAVFYSFIYKKIERIDEKIYVSRVLQKKYPTTKKAHKHNWANKLKLQASKTKISKNLPRCDHTPWADPMASWRKKNESKQASQTKISKILPWCNH